MWKNGKSRAHYSMWKSTGDACETLGMTPDHLRRLRDACFKEGVHYRNIARPQAARPTYRWHVAKIEKLLNEPQECRGV